MTMKQKYIVADLEQDSPEWLAWRENGITATDAVVLMAEPGQGYKTPWRLWAEKVGYASPTDISGNPNVRRGNRLEPIARAALEEKYQTMLFPACVESAHNRVMRASLDGLTDDGKPVEIKAPSKKVWASILAEGESSEAFKLYWMQIQHQMLVLGAKEGFLVFYDEDEGLKEFTVKRDDAFCRNLIRAAAVMWKQIVTKSAPEKDPERDEYIPMGEDAEAWKAAAYQYRLYQAEIDVLKAQMKSLQEKQGPLVDEMKALMAGHRKTDLYGVTLTEFEAAGSVDYRKVVEEKLNLSDDDLDHYRKPSSVRHRVTVTDRLMPKDIKDSKVREMVDKAPVLPPEEVEDAYF